MIDAAGQRGFLVRNGRVATADLTTGEVTEDSTDVPFVQLAGYDAVRGHLLALTSEITGGTDSTTVYESFLTAYRPATQDTVRIARVLRYVIPVDSTGTQDGLLSVSGPAVADGDRLVTIRNGRQLAVDLVTGALTEGPDEPDLGELLGYDASADVLYRLDRVTTFTDTSQTAARVVTRQTAGGVPDTLATVAQETLFADGSSAGDLYLASLGLAVYDAAGDRVVLNRSGTYLVVELGTGQLRTGPAASAGVVGGALSARVVSNDNAPGRAPVLRASPNPARGAVRVAVGARASARVEVLDALGRRVELLADGPTADEVTWDASRVPPGVYRVRVVSGDDAASVPVTVVR